MAIREAAKPTQQTRPVGPISLDERRAVVRITVRDGSPLQPSRKSHGSLATRGRGLALVDTAAEAFGIEALTEGKAIWFELPVPGTSTT